MELKKRLQRAEGTLGLSYEEGLQSWKHQVAMKFLTAEDRELLSKGIARWRQDPTTPRTGEIDRVVRLYNLAYDYFALTKYVEMTYEDRADLMRDLRQAFKTLREKGIDRFPGVEL